MNAKNKNENNEWFWGNDDSLANKRNKQNSNSDNSSGLSSGIALNNFATNSVERESLLTDDRDSVM